MTDTIEQVLGSSEYVRIASGGDVVSFKLPDGRELGLSARQAATAEVFPHGNATWSRIRFTMEVEADVYGSSVDVVRGHIIEGLHDHTTRLLRQLVAAHEKHQQLQDKLTAAQEELAALKGTTRGPRA